MPARLQNMLKLATGFKKSFDELCTKLKHKLHQHVSQTPGYGVEFCSAAIKSVASAASKVNTEYHGDCRQLKEPVGSNCQKRVVICNLQHMCNCVLPTKPDCVQLQF